MEDVVVGPKDGVVLEKCSRCGSRERLLICRECQEELIRVARLALVWFYADEELVALVSKAVPNKGSVVKQVGMVLAGVVKKWE